VPLDLGNLSSGEWRLNMIGIGLLLFGVAFLFMFSVQRGWISAPMRAGFGLAFGVALLAIGLRAYDKRWVLPPLPLASEFRERLVTPP
jgi:uncharacterized membrane protein